MGIEVLTITVVLALAAVGLHYEGMLLGGRIMAWLPLPARLRMGFFVLFMLPIHLLEALLFAVGYQHMSAPGLGSISGSVSGFGDFFYFSLVCYTSLGFGDLVPEGGLRIVAGVEALIGLVMIAWTASYTYLMMRDGFRTREVGENT
jgi:hypothetical protein